MRIHRKNKVGKLFFQLGAQASMHHPQLLRHGEACHAELVSQLYKKEEPVVSAAVPRSSLVL